MDKKTFEALKYIAGYVELLIEKMEKENREDEGTPVLKENLKRIEDWIAIAEGDYEHGTGIFELE